MTKNIRLPVQSKTSAAARARALKGGRRRGPKTKKQVVIALLERTKGASIAEMQRAMGWQEHSIRGFLAATVKKMPGVTLLSEKTEDGPRRYRIEVAGE